MLGPTTHPSQRVIALDDDKLLGAKRRSRASGFVRWRLAADEHGSCRVDRNSLEIGTEKRNLIKDKKC